MNTNKNGNQTTFVLDLARMAHRTPFRITGQETTYFVEGVRIQDGFAVVRYTLSDNTGGTWACRPFSTVEIVSA